MTEEKAWQRYPQRQRPEDAVPAVEAESKPKKADPYILYTIDDPDRPPFWRYDRIKYLLGKDDQVFIPNDDIACRIFYLFCQETAEATTPEEKFILKKKYPGIAAALQLRKYTPLDTLGLLEGFMLTEVDIGWLSNKFSLKPETVAWYEQLFLDAWDRRDANFWIESEVIQCSKYPGHKEFKLSPAYDRACAYRRFGYHGGIIALELFATGFLTTDTKPHHKELAETFIKRALEMSVSNEGALMGGSRRKLNKTEGEFLKLALDLANRSLQVGAVEIVQNIQKALTAVTPLVGDQVKDELTRLAIADADTAALLVGAAEIRQIEQSKLFLGLEMAPETRTLITQFNESRQANN